jgi:hypothetical protein
MSERSERLQSILVAHIEAAEKGQAPGRVELLRRHFELAVELTEFFDGREGRHGPDLVCGQRSRVVHPDRT